ncbi:MAG TPA: hypothetical protein VFX89_09845 [Gammaproteobacteria bacterium]|nr:hypothetical protein [Gammaproteobacteria bacterium]
MNERRTEQTDLERRTKRAFDDSVGAIDAATRSKLTQARHRALQELERKRRSSWWLIPKIKSPLAPVGALAAVALAALLLVWRSEPPPMTAVVAPVADLDILLGDEDLEMLDEDLEFYAWLEEQPELSAPATAGDGVG